MTKTAILATIFALAAPLAQASNCQHDLREIDKAFAKPRKGVTAENVAEARKIRAEGASLCHAGKDEAARDALRPALRLLKIA